MKACNDLLLRARDAIKEEDESVKGLNVGVNVGEAAGQTIFAVERSRSSSMTNITRLSRWPGSFLPPEISPRTSMRNVLPS